MFTACGKSDVMILTREGRLKENLSSKGRIGQAFFVALRQGSIQTVQMATRFNSSSLELWLDTINVTTNQLFKQLTITFQHGK
jgi:hypothetical protein